MPATRSVCSSTRMNSPGLNYTLAMPRCRRPVLDTTASALQRVTMDVDETV